MPDQRGPNANRLVVTQDFGGADVVKKLMALLGWWALISSAISISGHAQQARTYRIGVLLAGSPQSTAKLVDVFRSSLRELGYDEAKNVSIEFRFARGDANRFPDLARELAGLNVDVFLASTEPAIHAAKDFGNRIPIVALSCDPLEKLLGNLARPGGNATGFSCVSSDLIGKRFGLLKALLPSLRRVAMFYRAQDAHETELNGATRAAREIGVELIPTPVQAEDHFEDAFQKMVNEKADAVYLLASGFTVFHQAKLAQLALKRGLPSIFAFREYPESGGLMSYGASLSDMFKRGAYHIDKILKGTPPRDIPAEEPTRFELLVNMKIATALGIEIPDIILVQATEVID
jgi:putative ABC transport system substrate-binding protein